MRRNWVPTAAARQAVADAEAARLKWRSSVFGFAEWMRAGQPKEEPITLKEARMDPIEQLREAMLQHAEAGETLSQAVRRWTPDKANPGRALDGSDLDAHPPEHRARKLREAQIALKSHRESTAPTVLNPLIAAAGKEPAQRFQQGTVLGTEARGEVPLLVEQYRDLTRQQKAELGVLGVQALERGDIQMALAHKRAADVLHISAPDLDAALAEGDPERVAGKAQIDKLERWVEAHQIDEMRRYARAGIASTVEQVEASTWAQQHGLSEDGGSYVQAMLSGE